MHGPAEKLRPERILRRVAELTRFHRIQGSKGLVDAVEYLRDELSNIGLSPKTHYEKYDGKSWYLTLRSPIAWDLLEGEVRFNEKTLSSEETPLVVMAHSPPGEGEAEIVPILNDSDWERAHGKVVLVGKNFRKAYGKANEIGAVAFVSYREGTDDAVPYIGLFLTEEDLKWAKIPAFAVPESWAKKMISDYLSGKKPRLSFRAVTEIKSSEKLPILYTEIGEPPFILLTAHICHPRPGANDNASGSAMLVELAEVLSKVYESDFRFGFAFLWIPEYYGSQAFIGRKGEPNDYYSAINLDMVGGSEDRSGSTIMLVRTPLSRFSIVSGVLEYFLKRHNLSSKKSLSGSEIPAVKFRAYPYEMGSDHDVFNFFGIPSVMPITWPDRFYHSNMDTPEKLSMESLAIIGRSVLSSVIFLAGEDEGKLRRFARGYSLKYLGELAMERETEMAEKLVMLGLSRDSKFTGMDIGYEFEKTPWLRWKLRGRIGEDIIKNKAPERLEEFEKLTEEGKALIDLHELVMLGELLPKNEAYKALSEEYGEIEKSTLEVLIGLLEEAEIVETV
ncbi:DUF4910 domain-containing protein [Thermococcus zilligii]|uniref:DUF4910 domain-containing protein n=1 Tax=Thermococcus zilligii TaxID=54076 RepID=UPI00029ADC86|nr:DUF4910 domain-containing protein [Thermococcus zilligii]